ncbi:TetR family transcriptional regulator [Muribaculaceae bacterium Isolate-042 (Harlan)]|uniref:TetR/AcrR family transcriptional regulator n=1 Tax=Muribaculum intestinale TaxID=1796646 RepID=UPI000F4A68F7|nr:TetR family transcriptional regulator [Muribaculum intestinale]ROS82950.1 TetR family transcriptional regulator [Muribaculaceae bacterium Isolate-042 (Harlan)]
MASKTREKLIEVARQLFAHKGIENTTMSDIATASEKGRRTIYTYFKNKREIYNAVIEKESEQVVGRLREIFAIDMNPLEKLMRFIDVRIDIVEETIRHERESPVLRTLMVRDVRRMERIRNLAVEKEIEMLRQIMDDGVKMGLFSRERINDAFMAMIMMFQGIELSIMRNNFAFYGIERDEVRVRAKNFILAALTRDDTQATNNPPLQPTDNKH